MLLPLFPQRFPQRDFPQRYVLRAAQASKISCSERDTVVAYPAIVGDDAQSAPPKALTFPFFFLVSPAQPILKHRANHNPKRTSPGHPQDNDSNPYTSTTLLSLQAYQRTCRTPEPQWKQTFIQSDTPCSRSCSENPTPTEPKNQNQCNQPTPTQRQTRQSQHLS